MVHRTFALFLLLLVPGIGVAATEPSCADDAIAHAKPLLALHFGEDDRVSIADEATEIAPLKNPKDPRQTFRVWEVWGYIYKGQYRMRFIYHVSEYGCLLMGQEVLEFARP